uniref:Uncharacterized protein n=1 Tax=Arundo donax TaxID=35708 RepID=A0A0A8YN93_ARUDO
MQFSGKVPMILTKVD